MSERNDSPTHHKLTLQEIRERSGNPKSLSFYNFFLNGEEDLPVLEEWKRVAGDNTSYWNLWFVTWEMVKNAYLWGNEGKSWKKTTIHYGWVDDYFYCVVQDQGVGFNMQNPVYHSISEGSGIRSSRERVDAIYNFGDSASYFCIRKPD